MKVNEIEYPAISIRERKLFVQTMLTWPADVSGLVVEKAERSTLTRPNESKKDIATLATIAGNMFTLKDMFLASGDTRKTGKYNICCLAKEPGAAPNANDEFNIVIEVID